MRPVLYILLVVCVLQNAFGARMSEAQLKAAMKMLRNVCQPKFKVTDEQINVMHKGDWNLEHNIKCYNFCILNMYKVMNKDNSFNWEVGLQTIEAQAPDSIRSNALASISACKDAVQTLSDKCEAAYEVTHCMYQFNPAGYFLP